MVESLAALTENQKWLYRKIMRLGRNKQVINMTDDQLFLVLDRVKFCYFLAIYKQQEKIEINKKRKKTLREYILGK